MKIYLQTGIPKFHDIEEVSANAIRICKSSHSDPRCVASAVCVSVMVALIMQVKKEKIKAYSADVLNSF